MAEVCQWVKDRKLKLDAGVIEDEGVDGATLLLLDDDMVAELGVRSKLQRTKILAAISKFS